MKNVMKSIAIVVLIIVAMLACESIFAQSSKKVVNRTYSIQQDQVMSVDDQHESDELVYRDKGEVQFLNQANPIADTLYTYFIKVKTYQCQGITKKGLQCKNRTTETYCRLHNKATVCLK